MKYCVLFISFIYVSALFSQSYEPVGIAQNHLIPVSQISNIKNFIDHPLSQTDDRLTLYNEQIYQSLYFDIHYTIAGPDAVSNKDDNQSGIPDIVEFIATTFDTVMIRYIKNKFTPPPPDNGRGGTDRYDIYILNLDAISPAATGLALTDEYIGDNINSTDIVESTAFSSYICIRNSYLQFKEPQDILIKATAAHEFMHSIQFGYGLISASLWFKEMTAVWAEQLIFPDVTDNFFYLPNFFNNPDYALNISTESDNYGSYGQHWYSTWIFAKYLTEHTNDSIINSIMKRTITNNELNAIESELKYNWNSSFSEIFNNFLISNLLLTNDSSFAPYTYSHANEYKQYLNSKGSSLYIQDNISSIPYFHYSKDNGNGKLMRLSADYFSISTATPFKIFLSLINKKAQVDMQLISINKSSNTISITTPVKNGDSTYIDYFNDNTSNTYFLIIKRLDKFKIIDSSEQYKIYVNNYPLSNNMKPISNSIYFDYHDKTISIPQNLIPLKIEVFNSIGNLIYNDTKPIIYNNRYPLSLTKPGMYLIKITDINNKIQIIKIINF